MALHVTVPVTTEVIEQNPDCIINGFVRDRKIIIALDARKQDHHQRLGLPSQIPIHLGPEKTIEIQELSGLGWPIRYEVTTADGWYEDDTGERHYFRPELKGLSLQRGVSWVVMRAAVFLSIIAGVGCRRAAWLLNILFQVTITKSSVHRWIHDVAETLPSADALVQLLNDDKPVSQGHLDELFPRGNSSCVLVLRDEYGRIIATEEVKKRDEAHVRPFLQRVKRLGLAIRFFYIDHCDAYKNAIETVYPKALIQYDHFHTIQNIWRHLYKYFVTHRKDIKARSEKVKTPWYKTRLEILAKTLWKKRHLVFKSEENMTEEEQAELVTLMEADVKISHLRSFLLAVRDLFNSSKDEEQAREALQTLKQKSIDTKAEPFLRKVFSFLDKYFEQMITYLKVPGTQRNSLAETGMRVLRRLELEHDGFRSSQGREDALRIYQAVKYLGWTVHQPVIHSVG